MKFLRYTFVIAIFGFGYANAGVIFEMESMNGPNDPAPKSSKTKVDGRNLKMSMDTNEDIIFSSDRREMITVNHREQSYMVIDEAMLQSIGNQLNEAQRQMAEAMKDVPPEQRAMFEEMMKQRMPQMATPKDKPLVEIRDTGEKAEKNGYPTRKHQLLINGRLSQEMWVTPWDEVEGGEEAIEAFQAMSEFFQKLQDSMPSFAQSGNSDGDFFEHMKSMDGFPVVTVSFGMSGQIEDINVLKSSQKASLPDSEFAPPAGYRREQMPGL